MKLRKINSLIVLALSLFIFIPSVPAKAAGSATLGLSPSGGSYNINSTLTVTVLLSSSDNVNAVQANLSYDSSKLQYLSINTSGSTFDIAAEATGGSGIVKIGRGSIAGVSGSGQTVASVSFKVLAGSGSGTISFAGSSAIVRVSDASNVWNGNTAGGTYNFITPAPSNPSTPSAPSSTPKTNTPQSSSPNNTDTISEVPTDQAQTPAEEPVNAEKDSQSNTYPIAITVKEGNRTVKNASVTLNGDTVQTDDNGVASFGAVPEGAYTASVSVGGGTPVDQTITVSKGDPSEVQSFSVVLQSNSDGIGLLAIIGGVVVSVMLLSGLAWFLYSKGAFKPSTISIANGAVIGGEDSSPSHAVITTSETIIRPTESNTTSAEEDKL